MNDLAKWVSGIAGTLLVMWMIWLSSSVLKMEGKLDDQDKVIPAPVENSLRELREKTNGQAESCNKAQSFVSNNTTEIGNLKERVSRLENQRER